MSATWGLRYVELYRIKLGTTTKFGTILLLDETCESRVDKQQHSLPFSGERKSSPEASRVAP
jgi:hypothetical protein